ncbi:MAG: uracil-DNA glycosylase [Deltaproteobacteria bacterium]|nr:uracil-DNA glycosylase [Deltaproteobacteria bacterium]
MSILDTPGHFLADLKKIIALHGSFGLDNYPMTPELRHFFKECRPGKRHIPKKPESPKPTPAVSLEDVRRQLGDCCRCALHKGRGAILFGRGSQEADLFIVGEYPDTVDDANGVLCSGPAGDLLTKMLAAIGLDLERVYFTNIVKCRASEEKLPARDEIAACLPFLMAQIEVVSPRVICAMGPLAAQVLLKSRQPLVRLRGRFRQLNGIPLLATFHPSYLLRNFEMKEAAWQDLQAIHGRLTSPVS